jgi:hypothetical protein
MADGTSVPIESENPTTSTTAAHDLDRFGPETPSKSPDDATSDETTSAPAQTSSQISVPTRESQASVPDNTPSPITIPRNVTGANLAPHNPQNVDGKETKANWFNRFNLDGLGWTLRDTLGLIHIVALMSLSVFSIAGIINDFPATAIVACLILSITLYKYIPAAERTITVKYLCVVCMCLIFLRASHGNWKLQSCHRTSHNISASDSGITMKTTNLTCYTYLINPKPTFFESANSTNDMDAHELGDFTSRQNKMTRLIEEGNFWVHEIYNQLSGLFNGFDVLHVAISRVAERLERNEEKMDDITYLLGESDKDRSREVVHH